MRPILVVSATAAEISPLMLSITNFDRGGVFPLWTEGDVPVLGLIAGIGAAPYSFHLTRVLSLHSFEFVLGVGIAGTYSPSLAIGDVVRVEHDTFADYGVDNRGHFESLFDCGLEDRSAFPFLNGWLHGDVGGSVVLPYLPEARGVTLAMASGSVARIEHIRDRYAPDVETMEGAALFYCCASVGVPSISIRAISNRVEPRNRDGWNIPLAVQNLSVSIRQVVLDLIVKFPPSCR